MTPGGGNPGGAPKIDLCIGGTWTDQVYVDGNVSVKAGAQVQTPGPTYISGWLKVNTSNGTSVSFGGPVTILGPQTFGPNPVPCE